jgi:hypothetical protein
MVVVLSEDQFVDPSSVNGREQHLMADTARMFGCRVYPLPVNLEEVGGAENALANLRASESFSPAVWIGYIPTLDRYADVYAAALAKRAALLNTPDEYRTAMEFDRFYPRLAGLTPESITVSEMLGLDSAAEQLGFPVFVRGMIKSNKDQGPGGVFATNPKQLHQIATALMARPARSLGKVALRRVVDFRAVATDPHGFALGREYRLFVYRGHVLAYGFYWDEYRDSYPLSAQDKHDVVSLAEEAARRVGTPYLSVDVGQLEGGSWTVIEVGDGQFSGLSQVSVLELWSRLTEYLRDPPGGS